MVPPGARERVRGWESERVGEWQNVGCDFPHLHFTTLSLSHSPTLSLSHSPTLSLSHSLLDDHLQLHGADLNHVAHSQRPLLTGVDLRTINERAIRAVEVLDHQLVVLEGDESVLPGRPDAVGRLLIFQVDIDGLLVGPADEIVAFVYGIFNVAFLAAQDDQPRLGALRQSDGF